MPLPPLTSLLVCLLLFRGTLQMMLGRDHPIDSGRLPPLKVNTFPDLASCIGLPAVTSCEFDSTKHTENKCCSPTPGGLILQTQLWFTWTGFENKNQLLPQGSWTIHGLWPDNCDGSFAQYCDLSRQYDPTPSPSMLPDGTIVPNYTGRGIDTFVEQFGRQDLLAYMDTYWVNQAAPNADFWAHEFSKHATCSSTFDVACYGRQYKHHQEVVNFFDTVSRVFGFYPTFQMLAANGIVPSNQTSYSLERVQTALFSQTGAVPYLGCINNGTVLSEVWYFNHIVGTEQYGTYKPVNSTTPSTCSQNARIWYHERTLSSERGVQIQSILQG